MVLELFRQALNQEHRSSTKGMESRQAAVLRRCIRLLTKTLYVTMAAYYQYVSMELLRLRSMDDRQPKEISTTKTQHRPRPPPHWIKHWSSFEVAASPAAR